MRNVALLFFLLAIMFTAYAEDGSAPCGGDAPPFADAAAFLESQGFSPLDYTLLLAWNERPPRGDGQLVYGYHVKPKGTSTTLDLYADAQGNFLGGEHLARLGVRPKNWRLKPLDKTAELPAVLSAKVLPRPAPVGGAHSVRESDIALVPPIALDRILQEDEQAEFGPLKGAVRVGVFSALAESITLSNGRCSLGAWRVLPNGSALWTVVLYAPSAKGQRIHFAELRLPAGAQVLVYNADDPTEAYGPYHGPYGQDSDLWSATCFSDRVAVECHVPAHIDVAEVTMSIDKIIYVYKDFDVLPWRKAAAGPCNLDAACYPDWSDAARGVAGIGRISSPGFLFCTGSLIADRDPATDIPYFLTANHCVDTSQSAATVEVYWLYQRDACGGTVPPVASVPRTTGGADYLAGNSNVYGTDFTLLRLRNAPPSGLTYLGWSSQPRPASTEVTGIHHPRGDYKRITFGTMTGGSRIKPADRYHEVVWHSGTTEPGSSGSPLLLTSTQQIIGQLYGGSASCILLNDPDAYGRFDVTFPLVQAWLAPYAGPEDIDGSGTVNALDVQIVINAALGLPGAYNADVNGSGTVDATDVQLVINAALSL